MTALSPRILPSGSAEWLVPLLALLLAGCDNATRPPAAVDIDELFAQPRASEIQSIEAEWASRGITASELTVVNTFDVPLGLTGRVGTARVVEQTVEGHINYGLVVTPRGATSTSLPVLVYGHGGDGGVSTLEIGLLLSVLGSHGDDFVIVAPTFRSEPLSTPGGDYRSGGMPSPWDRDVDDAISLLDGALKLESAADPQRVVAAGLSRGAGVALLMAIRDPHIRGVVEIAGPTDFFGDYVREIVVQTLEGSTPQLPGVSFLATEYLLPLKAGARTMAEVRLELARRSAVLFADRLPPVQIHHGGSDDVVSVQQANALASALGALPRSGVDELFLYPAAGHNPFEMPGLTDRITRFLDRVLGV